METLLKELTTREGKKVQVSRGNMKEVMSKLADTIIENPIAATEWNHYIELKRLKKTLKDKADFAAMIEEDKTSQLHKAYEEGYNYATKQLVTTHSKSIPKRKKKKASRK